MEEYKDILSSPIGATLQWQVKNSIKMTLGSSLPNGSIYQHSILEKDEIKRKIQEFLLKGHIRSSSSTVLSEADKETRFIECIQHIR